MITGKRMRWSGYVARMEKKHIRSFGENSSRRETTFNNTGMDLKRNRMVDANSELL
jgi:hypothetical protein